MGKTDKQLLFERMNKIGKMPINEDVYSSDTEFMKNVYGVGRDTNKPETPNYPEKAGQGQGMVANLINNIDEAIKYMDEMLQHSPELATDIKNIKKRLTLGIDNMRGFGEGKEHKRKGNIRGMWGVDDDDDGLVDGSTDGSGFAVGDGGGGE